MSSDLGVRKGFEALGLPATPRSSSTEPNGGAHGVRTP